MKRMTTKFVPKIWISAKRNKCLLTTRIYSNEVTKHGYMAKSKVLQRAHHEFLQLCRTNSMEYFLRISKNLQRTGRHRFTYSTTLGDTHSLWCRNHPIPLIWLPITFKYFQNSKGHQRPVLLKNREIKTISLEAFHKLKLKLVLT